MELLNVLCFKYISTITPTNVNIITNVTVYKPCILTKTKIDLNLHYINIFIKTYNFKS